MGMAFSADELDQIRNVVRTELQQSSSSGPGVAKRVLKLLSVLLIIFLAVLALHVIVIGGFTVYHLVHSH